MNASLAVNSVHPLRLYNDACISWFRRSRNDAWCFDKAILIFEYKEKES